MTSQDMKEIDKLKGQLSDRFKMEDLGEVKLHLGLKVRRDYKKKEIYLSQPQYIKDVLIRFGMWDSKEVETPMTTSAERDYLMRDNEPITKEPYREAVGALLYASICTRPDIAVAVGFFAKFVSEPTDKHWTGVKRIMRYLKGTWDYELVLGGDLDDKIILLTGYADADWAGDNDDRKSRTGYVFYINKGLITWKTKKQPTVAHSSTESEIMAAHAASCEALWIRLLLKELGWEQENPTVIRDDNTGCIALSKNPGNHGRTKHMDIKYHGLRENVLNKNVELQYCNTKDNVADMMTKGLPEKTFVKHRDSVGLRTRRDVVDQNKESFKTRKESQQERVLNARNASIPLSV